MSPILRLQRMARQVLRVFTILILIVAEANALYMCEGDDVKLFSNTSINSEESRLTLYHNNVSIFVWTSDGHVDQLKPETNITRDENYDIWFHNVSVNDQGLYFLLYSKRRNGSRQEKMNGSLVILVPPPTECRPVVNITQEGEIYYLNATWPETDCGTPQDALIWNSSEQNTSMLRVNSTENSGLYTACIRGPAMDCARDPSVYCSQIYMNKTEGEGIHIEKLMHDVDGIKQKDWVPIGVPIIICALILSAIIGVLYYYCIFRKKNQRRRNNSHTEQYEEVPTHDGKQNGDQQLQVLAENGHVQH